MEDAGQGRLPLEGVRVVEVSSGFAAGLAGRLLRGFGAHVTLVDATELTRGVALTDDERLALHTARTSSPARRTGARSSPLPTSC